MNPISVPACSRQSKSGPGTGASAILERFHTDVPLRFDADFVYRAAPMRIIFSGRPEHPPGSCRMRNRGTRRAHSMLEMLADELCDLVVMADGSLLLSATSGWR